jgi:hypothetical protein
MLEQLLFEDNVCKLYIYILYAKFYRIYPRLLNSYKKIWVIIFLILWQTENFNK